MMPGEPTPRDTAPAANTMQEPLAIHAPEFRWYHKMSAVLFATFCLEIGCFLLIFPWTEYWDSNYFSGLVPSFRDYWDNMYVRGGLSGIGVVNLYIALVEMLRLRRFSKHG
jgi:hypothetical protein